MITYIKDIAPASLAYRYGLICMNTRLVEGFENERQDCLYVYTFGGVILLHKNKKRQFVPNNLAEVVFRNAFN